jgi:hypothetical protein
MFEFESKRENKRKGIRKFGIKEKQKEAQPPFPALSAHSA